MSLKLDVDFNAIRINLVQTMMASLGLNQDHVILEEPEAPNMPRPTLPYASFKITTQGARYGDDTKQNIPSTNLWTSGGPRKMSVSFNTYGSTHEQAYNLMCLWQTALDEETTQEALRRAGISVLIIGTVADLSALLNTGYEGRAHLDCQFGLAFNVTSDLGEIKTVPYTGTVETEAGTANLAGQVVKP